MNIIITQEFETKLSKIVGFISTARKFYYEIYTKIHKIPQMPYSFRKNQLLNNENVRDMIYKGYVVVFKIMPKSVVILSIYKHNLWNPSDL